MSADEQRAADRRLRAEQIRSLSTTLPGRRAQRRSAARQLLKQRAQQDQKGQR